MKACRNAINTADANTNNDSAYIITLSVSLLPYTVNAGQLNIENLTSNPLRRSTIVGQGHTNSVVDAGGASRVFNINGTGSPLDVMFQNLGIEGGYATDGLSVAAQGGGVLIDGGTVTMSGVNLSGQPGRGFQRVERDQRLFSERDPSHRRRRW